MQFGDELLAPLSGLEPLFVVNVEKLWRVRMGDARLLEDRPQMLPKCLELFVGGPDLAHLQLAFGSKTDVVLKAVGRPASPASRRRLPHHPGGAVCAEREVRGLTRSPA